MAERISVKFMQNSVPFDRCEHVSLSRIGESGAMANCRICNACRIADHQLFDTSILKESEPKEELAARKDADVEHGWKRML
jgi:hypothetical protein